MFSLVRSMTGFSVLFEHNVYKYTTTQVFQSVLLEKLRYIFWREIRLLNHHKVGGNTWWILFFYIDELWLKI